MSGNVVAENGPAPASAGQDLVANLIAVMDALETTVTQETQLVRAGRLREAAPFERTKAELAQRYAGLTGLLQANGKSVAAAAPDRIDALREKHGRIQSLLQANMTVLATAHAVSEGIMRGVAGELARKAAPSTYGATGRTNAPGASAMQPLAVSRIL